jgi:hypothetical protein
MPVGLPDVTKSLRGHGCAEDILEHIIGVTRASTSISRPRARWINLAERPVRHISRQTIRRGRFGKVPSWSVPFTRFLEHWNQGRHSFRLDEDRRTDQTEHQ